MKLSIVLPVRNESGGIKEALDLIISSIADLDYEIVVINDFSEDTSYGIIDKNQKPGLIFRFISAIGLM